MGMANATATSWPTASVATPVPDALHRDPVADLERPRADAAVQPAAARELTASSKIP